MQSISHSGLWLFFLNSSPVFNKYRQHCLTVQIAVKCVTLLLFINSYSTPSNNSHTPDEIMWDNLVSTVFGTCIEQCFALSNVMSAVVSFTFYFCLTLNDSFIQSLPFFSVKTRLSPSFCLSLLCPSPLLLPFLSFWSLISFSFFLYISLVTKTWCLLTLVMGCKRLQESKRQTGHTFVSLVSSCSLALLLLSSCFLPSLPLSFCLLSSCFLPSLLLPSCFL